jgi:predicted TIM-barrel fold metal-dependent hydrolase
MRRREFIRVIMAAGAGAMLPSTATPSKPRHHHRLVAPRLDAHAHFFSPALVARVRSLISDPDVSAAVRPINAAYLLNELDRTGVGRAFVLSTAYVNATDVRAFGAGTPSAAEYRLVRDDNDFTATEAATAPTRLIPFASVNPKRDYAVDEVNRCVEQLGMRGLKLHFGNSDIRLRDRRHLERVRSVFICAAERNIPIVAHVHNDQVEGFGGHEIELLVSELIEPLPTLRLAVAHLGWGGGADRNTQGALGALVTHVGRRPHLAARVWVECSGVLLKDAFPPLRPLSPGEQSQIGPLIQAWGLDRLLWGSDTIPEALDQSRAVWPLSEAEWQTMAKTDGSALLTSDPH